MTKRDPRSAKTGPYCGKCNKTIEHEPFRVGLKDYHVSCFLRPHVLPFIAARQLHREAQPCSTSR